VRAWAGRGSHGSQLLANRSAGRTGRGGPWLARGRQDFSLAGSAQEIGPGVLDDKVHLYVSNDLKEWKTLKTFSHDKLPKRYFKFGVIGFADGKQTSDEFYMFFEAVKGFDGKSLKCSLL
jgi:hypothetical protein